MSETANKAKIAESICAKIFPYFLWEKSGPVNENWECTDSKRHDSKLTHPVDIVYWYDEAYIDERTYINIDLKSYGKETIQINKIENALRNLALGVNCSAGNKNWQDKYNCSTNSKFNVFGMLFVYNHDGLYNSSFSKLLNSALEKKIPLNQGKKIYVIDPETALLMYNIAQDIRMLKNEKFKDHNYSFYYPDLINHKKTAQEYYPATIESIKRGILFLNYHNKDSSKRELIIYYNLAGEKIEEFVYLYDMIMHYQMLESFERIEIRGVSQSEGYIANLERAKEAYGEKANLSHDIKKRLTKIDGARIDSLRPNVDAEQMGFDS